MNLWIPGGNGFLGKSIQKSCALKGISTIVTSKTEVDISSLQEVVRFLQAHSITHIVNCAAIANVDLAETWPEEAFKVNALGPENLGIASRSQGVKVLHFSTEYIFNASPPTLSFKETDSPVPDGVYALTKREGEVRLLAANPHACIIRTSWLFGGKGKTFLSSLLQRIETEEILHVASDQIGKATYVHDLASLLFFFLPLSGLYHFANRGKASRYDIALEMKRLALNYQLPIRCKQILPLSSTAFQQANQRPLSCCLDTSLVEQLQGRSIRTWQEAVDDLVYSYAIDSPV